MVKLKKPISKVSEKRKPFNSIKKSVKRLTWDEKMKLKKQRKVIKDRDEKMKNERKRALEEKRKRREEALIRKKENERKAEVVQPIKNSAKLKRLSKKELRKVRKA